MNFWILSMVTILMWERSVTLRRLNSIRRQNVEWGMKDLTCGSGFQIHGNWWRGLIRKEFLLQSAKVAEEDQTYATSYLGMEVNAAEERKVLGLNWDIIRDILIIRFDWLVRFTKELPRLNDEFSEPLVNSTILSVSCLRCSLQSRSSLKICVN